MRGNLLRFLSSTAIIVLLSVFAFAQDSRVLSAAGDVYVISAKAGGVNFVEGKVAIARKNGKSGLLLKGDNVEIGDKISTSANGKAEVLLNPGSFVRLAGNSALEFVSTDLDDLQIKLNSGSAIFEVFADKEFSVAINTPKSNYSLIQSGVYRVDLLPDGNERIEVWKGQAQIGNGKENVVKGGKLAVINNGQVQIEKFDRDEKDEFEIWSKTRAKDLAKINSKLERNLTKNSLINSFNQRGWNMYDSFGVWVYNAAYGVNCFLPFGYGWRSPYGFGFNSHFGNYNLPWYVYYQPHYSNSTSNTGNNTTPSNTNTEKVKQRLRLDVPPYEKVGGRNLPPAQNNDNFDYGIPSRSSQPASAPSAPVISPGGVVLKPGKDN